MSKWVEVWYNDKEGMLQLMYANMRDDIRAGYDLYGECITEQRRVIDEYKARFDRQIDDLKDLDERQAERWCYLDMRRRGAIA